MSSENAMPMVQLIAPDGTAVGDTEIGLSDDELRELLRLMIRARRLDRECWALQRQGELTVYPPFEGQEAAQVGNAFALGPADFAFPSFRELAAAMVRGVDVVEYLQYHRGTWHGGPYDPYASGFAPICVPVATQIVHAVGWAMGATLDDKTACSLAYFGDGSASEGDFHEAANMAAVFGAPAILFCQNNGWAISVPAQEQYVAPIAARAAGYGFPGVRVDGNDVLARTRSPRGGRPRPLGRRSHADRGDDVPDGRALDGGRRFPLPGRGGGRGLASSRSARTLPPAPARSRPRRRDVGRERRGGGGDVGGRHPGRAHGARRATDLGGLRPHLRRTAPDARQREEFLGDG
jgi:hypothetical protein